MVGETRYRDPLIVGQDVVIGYTDRNTVKLDFNNVSYNKVKSVSKWLKKRFNLEGFIILRSSEDSYHVVFNRSVTWEENMKIIGFASFMCSDHFKNNNVMSWAIMQMIKGSSTLRISTKFYKHRPRIIYKEGSQDKEIKAFREYREIFRRLQ